MNKNSALGPNGFGPSFYAATWDIVCPRVMAFLDAFYHHEVDLERINRSYMVLLPKKPGAVKVTDYRPICLQNCSIKIAVKLLTTRLQQEISELIDLDQTGFLKGRSISENFMYATELVQVCFQRKAPTVVLKLDFAKAFDTVNWESLLAVFRAWGFNSKWCQWISQLLSTSLTAVLINGCPGPWFSCRRGLRQGDPMSSYLFLLVANVLQTLFKQDDCVWHSLVDATCLVLQYVDDTLLLLRGELPDVCPLKLLLEQFADATGLKINFNKSMVVPMHMSEDALVSSISPPLRPKGRNGLVTAPWSGAPNQSMVGGPPSHSAIKRGWGPRLAVRDSPRRRTHPTSQTLTDRGSTGAAGSSATAAAEALFLDPAHPVSPPDARPNRS
jgi:hypothetical protein